MGTRGYPDPEEDYEFEIEYVIIDIEMKKTQPLVFTNGWVIKTVLSTRQGSMDDTWYLTVLIERESVVNG